MLVFCRSRNNHEVHHRSVFRLQFIGLCEEVAHSLGVEPGPPAQSATNATAAPKVQTLAAGANIRPCIPFIYWDFP